MSFDYHETLEKADINTNSSGDNVIIAAPTIPGQYIAIDYIQYYVTGTVTVQMKSITSPAAGSVSVNYGGPFAFTSGQSNTLSNVMHNEHGIITLPPNTGLNLNLNAGVQVSGFVRYRIIYK